MKILNLYAGIGGNRKLWGDEHQITAVELVPEIAEIYKDYFPNDRVIIGDAHQYLLDHYEEFDFIWASPPCPSHSKARKQLAVKSWGIQNKPIYPDMKLYQEILLLQGYFEGKYCVENVIGWYEPLMPAKKIASHYFWSNFNLSEAEAKSRGHDLSLEDLAANKGFNLIDLKNGIDKRKALRNCVHPETGLYILNCAQNIITRQNEKQIDLFE